MKHIVDAKRHRKHSATKAATSAIQIKTLQPTLLVTRTQKHDNVTTVHQHPKVNR